MAYEAFALATATSAGSKYDGITSLAAFALANPDHPMTGVTPKFANTMLELHIGQGLAAGITQTNDSITAGSGINFDKQRLNTLQVT